jgi:hypothetical protein
LQAPAAATSTTNAVSGGLTSVVFNTVTTGWSGGRLAVVKVTRLGSDGADTLAVPANLVMVKIEWVANTESD